MIGDMFRRLFDFLSGIIGWVVDMIGGFFQILIDIILTFIEAIFAIIAGILYFLFKIGVLAVKLFMVMFEIAKILYSLIVGLGNTLASMTYTPQGNGGNGYSEMIGNVFNALDNLNLAPIAYISMFVIWFITAIGAIRIISNIKL